MSDLRGMYYLKRKLNQKRHRVEIRYDYYNMKNALHDFNITIPKEWRWLKETLGWCGTAVDSLADRLVFRGWKNDNFDLQGIFDMNNKDIFFDSAVLSACISSCCFVYISAGDDGFPVLEVIDGGNATGIIDSTTGMLTEGYAVLKRNENKYPVIEAYFTPDVTEFHVKGEEPYQIENPALSATCTGYSQTRCTKRIRSQQDNKSVYGNPTGCTENLKKVGGCSGILFVPPEMDIRALAGCRTDGFVESNNIIFFAV